MIDFALYVIFGVGDYIGPALQELRRYARRNRWRRLQRRVRGDAEALRGLAQQLGNGVLHLRALDIESIALTPYLIEQRLRLADIELTDESMLELVVHDLISMLQDIHGGIEDAEFRVGLAQAEVIHCYRGADGQLDKAQISG